MSRPRQGHRRGLANSQACYPERQEPAAKLLERLGLQAEWLCRHRWGNSHAALRRIVPLVAGEEAAVRRCTDEALRGMAAELRGQLRRYGFRLDLVARSFAIIREASGRTLGKYHFDTQLLGGWALLRGVVAEMATGEGKSLCATLPACTAAFAAMPVHVVSVNDYLVARDAAEMAPLYRFFNLQVGEIVAGLDPAARKAAYGCDITYCNNKELVFDYLKDRLVLGNNCSRAHLHIERLHRADARADRLLLRGLHFAIVDEADSVLIDEARTPLIISSERPSRYPPAVYTQALALAATLAAGSDFIMDRQDGSIRLTEMGRQRLEGLADTTSEVWRSRRSREELTTIALTARHRYHKDRHYLVTDGTVQIVDEYTGRTMPDRSWEGGLHQMIEAKEGCAITNHRETIARITYQRFFRRYLLLSGMTGTAAEVAKELWTVYELQTIRIPTHRPLRRRHLPSQVHATIADKWQAVLAHVSRTVAHNQQPVLIGTRSVEASEQLSRLFRGQGVAHVVLNARQDSAEAEIVSHAGELGRITIATNMAGRGTDIKLGPGVIAQGGLHVILTERHDSRRIDRQLFGRCARQGDPGSCIAIVSLEDELLKSYYDRHAALLGTILRLGGRWWRGRLTSWHLAAAQRAAEQAHARIRRDTLEMDRRLDRLLAFSGRVE